MKKINYVLALVVLVWPLMMRSATADHIVISEIKTSGGTGKTTDEFIELYNPTSAAVDLNGWSLVKKTASGSDYVLVDNLGDKKIPANGYFLVAHPTGYAGSVMPDIVYSTANSISDNNTVLLKNMAQEIVDQAGYGTATVYEGEAAANPPALKSLERKAKADSTADFMIDGGRDYFAGNGEDSNNNKNDFIIRDAPEPQNSLNEPELVTAAAPTVPITNTNTVIAPTNSVTTNTNKNSNSNTNTALTPTTNFPSTPDVSAPKVFDFSKKVVLSELFPACAGADENCEFIEIYNGEDRQVKLAGWAVTDKKVKYRFPDTASIPAHGYIAVKRADSKIALNNTGKKIYLLGPDGQVVSGVEYGSAKEDQSFARTLDGKGWQWTEKPTPGAANEFTEDGDEIMTMATAQPSNVVKNINMSTTNQVPRLADIAKVSEDQVGTLVVVTGVVDSISGRSFYLVDESGNSIRVYVPKKPGLETLTVKAGDSVTITGEVSKTDAGLRIVPRTKDDLVIASKTESPSSGAVLGASTIQENSSIAIPAKPRNSAVITYVAIAAIVTIGAVVFFVWKSKGKVK